MRFSSDSRFLLTNNEVFNRDNGWKSVDTERPEGLWVGKG